MPDQESNQSAVDEGTVDRGSSLSPLNAENDNKAERRHAVTVAILAGLVGIIGTLVGSLLQIISTNDAQNAEFTQERAKEDREHRTEVYLDFLRKADRYSQLTNTLTWCSEGPRNGDQQEGCMVALSEFKSAHLEFFDTYDQVYIYIYGSTEAEKVASDIADMFGGRIYGGSATDVEVTIEFFVEIDGSAIMVNYIAKRYEYVNVLCQELPAQPRSHCQSSP